MYTITIVLLATYAAAGTRLQKFKNNALRVHHGHEDSTGKYPYVVALKGTYPALEKLCTGSLIKATWVLSASHCLIPSIKYIQYGNMSKPLAQTKSKSVVLKMIRQPGYIEFFNNIENIHNDIGLLMVERVNDMPKYARISAVEYRSLMGQPVEYAGFGMTYFPKRETKNKVQEYLLDFYRPLQVGEGVVTPCEEISRKDLICARAKCNQRKQMVLQGDSGGPLLYDNKIVGVTFAVGIEMFMQSFTPVSPHISWIYSVISGDRQGTTHKPVAGRTARIKQAKHRAFQ